MDSSALIKIYIDETGSEGVRLLRERTQTGEILTGQISGAEVFAAFYRRFRTGHLSKDDLEKVCQLFHQDIEEFFTSLPVTKHIVDAAMRLIQKYPLRGYDAIQLATVTSLFSKLQQVNGEILDFVSSDKILNDAARSEGLTIINPSDQK